MSEVRLGKQTPTICIRLPYTESLGTEAVDLYNKSDRTAQPWQELMLEDIMAVTDNGLWLHMKFGWSIPRRNGKSEILIMRAMHGITHGERVLYTAHRTTTSHNAWEKCIERLSKAGYIEGVDFKTTKQFGLERIEWLKGDGIINFRTRSSKGGLGEGYDLLIIDEAQEYTSDQESALKYQVSADTAERLTIEGAVDPDDGHTYTVPYIDDADAIAQYGIIVGTAEFEDITVPENLVSRGKEYLAENNRIKKHYAASVLDIVGRGSIRAGNTYRFRNELIGLDENLRLLKRKVDLLKPYTPDVEIGDKTAKISSMTAQNRHMLDYTIPQQLSQTVQQSKAIASQLINAATTGYVVLRPNEILIMDTDDVATATSVWRWNVGGLGYSHSSTPGAAYTGTYGTAITMNGMIVADFIAAGTMYADRIRGGTLRMGGDDNVNGVIEVVDANGAVVCRLDKDGAYILGSVYAKNSSGYWVELSDGDITGGKDNDTYVRMDATAMVTDTTASGSTTYHGLRIYANAVSFENCKHLGINNGTGGSYLGLTGDIQLAGTVSLDVQTATLEHVAIIDPSDNSLSYTNLTYVTGVTATAANGQTIHFESGLATA